MKPDQDKCASIEQAMLYRLGEMSRAESERFEQHMRACADCCQEAVALEPVLDELALAAPEVDPPADLLERLKQRVRSEPRGERKPWLRWESDVVVGSRLLFTWAQEGKWEPTQVEGIEARRLFVDRAGDRVTMLIRMAAGTAYPPHVHGGPEECYVLAGDLRVGDKTMGPGDYQLAPQGSEHGVQSTANGCVLLIASSLSDRAIG